MKNSRFPVLTTFIAKYCFGGSAKVLLSKIVLIESRTSRRIQELIVKSIFHFPTSALLISNRIPAVGEPTLKYRPRFLAGFKFVPVPSIVLLVQVDVSNVLNLASQNVPSCPEHVAPDFV